MTILEPKLYTIIVVYKEEKLSMWLTLKEGIWAQVNFATSEKSRLFFK